MSVAADLLRFHALLTRLQLREGGSIPLKDLDLRRLPRSGVYFFLQDNSAETASSPRVVRVGTHGLISGSRSTIGQRLGQHRGNRDGSGNHRGSIFRLLVGEALLRRGDHPEVPSWGLAGDLASAAARLDRDRLELKELERPLEQQASGIIGAMLVTVLRIEDAAGPDSLRGLVERNAIGLLSSPEANALHPPSTSWLGHCSSRKAVRESGLWNNRHVGEGYDPRFLDIIDRLIG